MKNIFIKIVLTLVVYNFYFNASAQWDKDNARLNLYGHDSDYGSGEWIENTGNTIDEEFGISFYTASERRMVIHNTSGYVGIGTSSPLAKFHVEEGDIMLTNPNDAQHTFLFDFNENIPRIRVGGSGDYAENGLDIQSVDNVSLMRLLDNGNVGIGTTSPKAKLDVNGNVHINTNGDDYNWLHFWTDATDDNPAQIWSDARDMRFGTWDNITDQTWNELVRFTHDGNVGIGTTSPEEKLHIYGSGIDGLLKLESTDESDAGVYFKTPLAEYKIGAGVGFASNVFTIHDMKEDATRMLIDENGNVGIGTSAPTAKLHVEEGNILISNPNDAQHALLFDFNENIPRIRIGGSGDYAKNGLDIQSVGDVSLMRLLDNGNIGIGTTSPEYKLDVNGDTRLGAMRVYNGKYFNGSGQGFTTDENAVAFDLPDDGTISFSDKVIFTDGNVGIGTTDPQYSLDIHSDNSPSLNLESSSLVSGIRFSNSADDAYFAGLLGDDFVIYSHASSGVAMWINEIDNIGLGTSTPESKLHVVGDMLVQSGDNDLLYVSSDEDQLVFVGEDAYNQYEQLKDDSDSKLMEYKSNYSMWVSQGIVAEDLAILNPTDWSDYVFEKEYKLSNLEEVEAHIEKNGYLPGMPSENEIKKEGYTVHEMNTRFLAKIEELTLYTIEQDKQIKELQNELSAYKELAKEVAALKQLLKNQE